MKTIMKSVLAFCLLCMLSPLRSSGDTNFGGKTVVEKGRTVEEAVSLGGDVIVYGTVEEDAVSFGGDTVVAGSGEVKGDAVSIGGKIKVRRGGRVRGDAVCLGGEVDLEPGGIIEGDIVDFNGSRIPRAMRHALPRGLDTAPGVAKRLLMGPFLGLFGAFGFAFGLAALLVRLLLSFCVAALVTYIFPGSVSRMAEYLEEDFPKALLFGLVVLVTVPFMLLFFVVTIVGIPLVPLAVVLLFFIYLFGSVGIALWIGRIIPESEGRSLMVNVLLGVLVVGIVKNIPVVGTIIGVLLGAAAFGVVLLSRSPGGSYHVSQ